MSEAGRRAVHLSPFRLYLLASVLLFSSLLSLKAPDATRVNLWIADKQLIVATVDEDNLNLRLTSSGSAYELWMAREYAEEFDELSRLPPQQVLDSLFASLRRVLPGAFILFVPFLAFGLKVLYLRKRILYVDHLVFALHFQSALFLWLAAVWGGCRMLGAGFGPSVVSYVLGLLVFLLIYPPLSLRRFYRQRWPWTILKGWLLLFIYVQLMGLIFSGAFLVIVESMS